MEFQDRLAYSFKTARATQRNHLQKIKKKKRKRKRGLPDPDLKYVAHKCVTSIWKKGATITLQTERRCNKHEQQ